MKSYQATQLCSTTPSTSGLKRSVQFGIWTTLKVTGGHIFMEKIPIDRFSAQYCFDKLLSDTDRNLREEGVRTDENARALSVAIKQELPNELGRYKSVNNDRMREIDQSLQVDFKVTQVMAAERLRVGTRWIRKLEKQGKLEKLPTGSIKSESLLKLLAKRGESTSS